MFHLYINLAYYIPHLYLFLRIKDHFISRKYRLLYAVIYLSIAAIFPLVGLHPSQDNFIMGILASISEYLLPFYLYLFLLMVVFDLFLLINSITGILKQEVRKTFAFRWRTLTTIFLLSAGIVLGGAVNLNTIQVSKYSIRLPSKKSKTDHLRVAFVADAHIQENFPQDFLDQFVSKINALEPDILLCGGDLVEGGRMNGRMETIETKLREIKTKYGVYAVLGNHEGYGRREPESFFRNAGITLLKDTIITVDSIVYLGGRMDKQFHGRKSLNELLGENTVDHPLLLMDHRPTELQDVSRTAVDVQFSGHTHNGQLFPLNFIIHSMYELSWGFKKIGNTHFFVTSGLRLWGPPVKTAGKAEIMLIDIQLDPKSTK